MPLYDLPAATLLVALVVTTIGAVLQGSVGFGMAVVAAPILLAVAPDFVPGSLMVAAMVLSVMVMLRERHAIVGGEVLVSSLARFATSVPTAYMVSLVDEQTFAIVFSVAVLSVVAISFAGFSVPFNTTNLAIASGISGISNTISSIGGPPMAIMYQSQRGDHIRATLAAIFAIGSLISILSLAAVGEFGTRDLVLGLCLTPGLGLGFAISRHTTRRIDGAALRPLVLGVAGAAAVIALIEATWGS